MFASMQRIAVALLVVAFVPASVPAEDFDDKPNQSYVSDLYSAADHTFVGSFNIEDAGHGLYIDVNKSLHFASKYPYVAVILHRAEDVSLRCRTYGPALSLREEGTQVEIYSGKYTGILDNSGYNAFLGKSSSPMKMKSTFLNSVVVMYSVNPADAKHSPIACGKLRQIDSTDDFLKGYTNQITRTKPEDLSSTSNRQISPSMLSKFEALTDLYSAADGSLVGSLIYQTLAENSLEVGVLHFSGSLEGGNVIAVVYHSKDVMPGCVTTGPAVAVRDELNVTRPVTLFRDQTDAISKPIYGNIVDYASVSRNSDYDIMGHVVVFYISGTGSLIDPKDFLQPETPHIPVACGSIRSADASEDNFLKWAPAGPKPTLMSETRKWGSIVDSLVQRLQKESKDE